MLKNILIPLDGSPLSEQAISYAQNVVAPGSNIVLLCVVEIPTNFDYAMLDIPLTLVSPRAYTDDEYNSAVGRVEEYLDKHAEYLQRNGYTVETVIEAGDPADAINLVAATKDVEVIVMTTHGRTGFNKFLFGSVTQQVMARMVCPILAVPGKVPEKVKEPVQVGRQIPATS